MHNMYKLFILLKYERSTVSDEYIQPLITFSDL